MAITFIYAIKATGEKSLDYDTEDKEAKILKKDDSKDSLEYVLRDKKGNVYNLSADYLEKMKNYISDDGKGNLIFHTIANGLNCTVGNAYEEWKHIRAIKNPKNGNRGNLQYCIVQNFGIDLDPAIANEIGMRFAQEYLSDYQCVVSTHINTGHVHNHIEFNATSFVTGKKFNDDLKAVSDIRKISDELCTEYELEVLEQTKEFNYVVYKDANGKTKVFEPTERKGNILEGEYANKNDYRNTKQYDSILETSRSHSDILKADIDRLLLHARNYDDLLKQLSNLGYEIKAKTKNGEWRKHISFKFSDWQKPIRDSHLGDGYTRIELEEKIKLNSDGDINFKFIELDHEEEDEVYEYGRIVIEDIDEEYRYRRVQNPNNEELYEKVNRSKVEKEIIRDTKELNNIIKGQISEAYRPKRVDNTLKILGVEHLDRESQELIRRINADLKTLRFVEKRELHSFDQIIDMVKALREKRDAVYENIKVAKAGIELLNKDLVTVKQYKALKETIERNSGNEEYALYEMQNDKEMLKSYEDILKERNLYEEEKQLRAEVKLNSLKNELDNLTDSLTKFNLEIREYDDCVLNLGVVKTRKENRYADEIKIYFEEKKSVSSKKAKENKLENEDERK